MPISEKASRWMHRVVLPLAVGIPCAFGADTLVGWESHLNLAENDLLMERARNVRTPVKRYIWVVEITPETGKGVQLTPDGRVPRSTHAELLRRLDAAHARVALFDLYFDEPGVGDGELKSVLGGGLDRLKVTLGNKYREGDMGGEDFVPTDRGFLGRYSPSVIYDSAWRPQVEMGGMAALSPRRGSDRIGAPAFEKSVDGPYPRLHCAFQAVLQYVGASDEPRLEAGGTRLAAGYQEWDLPFNHGVLVAWPQRLAEFRRVEYSEALRMLSGPQATEFRDAFVVVGVNKPDVDRVETGTLGEVPGCLFVAGVANTLLQPPSHRLALVPDAFFYPFASLLAALSFALGFSRRGSISLLGVGLIAICAWVFPILLTKAFYIQPALAPALGIGAAGVLGAFAAQSRLFREDHRAPGAIEEATAMFVDVRGSTALLQRIGPEDFRRLVPPFLLACDRLIARHGGAVERTQGDGCLAIFRPRPGRHHSLRCADAAREIVAEASRRGVPVGLGFETGMVSGEYLNERGRRIWSSVGATVNLAQRLQSTSEDLGAEIVVGPVARRLIQDEHPMRSLGTIEAKGFDEPVPASCLESERPEP